MCAFLNKETHFKTQYALLALHPTALLSEATP